MPRVKTVPESAELNLRLGQSKSSCSEGVKYDVNTSSAFVRVSKRKNYIKITFKGVKEKRTMTNTP